MCVRGLCLLQLLFSSRLFSFSQRKTHKHNFAFLERVLHPQRPGGAAGVVFQGLLLVPCGTKLAATFGTFPPNTQELRAGFASLYFHGRWRRLYNISGVNPDRVNMLLLYCSSQHAGMPRGSFCVFVFILLSFRSASLSLWVKS